MDARAAIYQQFEKIYESIGLNHWAEVARNEAAAATAQRDVPTQE